MAEPTNNTQISPIEAHPVSVPSNQDKLRFFLMIFVVVVALLIAGALGYMAGWVSSRATRTESSELVPKNSQEFFASPTPVMGESKFSTDTWSEYEASDAVLSFKAPTDWSVVKKDGIIKIISSDQSSELVVSYGKEGSVPEGYSGTSAGDLVKGEDVFFLGKSVSKVKLVYDSQTTSIFYGGEPGATSRVSLEDLQLLVSIRGTDQSENGISEDIERTADAILTTFQRVKSQ